MACQARVGGAFEGSPDLRFEPGAVTPGEFRFEIATAGASTLVLQTVLPALAVADQASSVEVTGGTHVPQSPVFEFLSRHWASVLGGAGLRLHAELRRAGFYPPGGGEVVARVEPWPGPGSPLQLEDRGDLLALHGVSAAGRVRGEVAERQAQAVRALLWEERRLEIDCRVQEPPVASPGSYLYLEAVFERGRLALSDLGRRGLRSEVLAERLTRRLLRQLDAEGAVDGHLADQLVVPLAACGCGGRVTTVEVTRHLQTVVEVASLFGVRARTWGRVGGPGGFELDRAV
jgi:RNA 3'-terminal phosphate cyclase (ATP)